MGNLQFKQISSFVNKMFKNADMFLTEHNEKPGVQEKLSRNLINRSFDMFKKKKEAAQQEKAKLVSRQSVLQDE